MRGDQENDLWFQIERTYLREKGLEGIGREIFAGNRVLMFMRECPTADWLDFLELMTPRTVKGPRRRTCRVTSPLMRSI